MQKSDGSLPTYEETVNGPLGSNSASKVSTGQRILDNITLTRSQNLSYVAGQHVIPAVEQRAREGISGSVVVLLPADIVRSQRDEISEYSFEDTTPSVEMMGFSDDEEVLHIQLEGSGNRSGLWKQSGVTDDLERLLRERLSTSSELQRTIRRPSRSLEPTTQRSPKPQKKGLFGRFSSSSSVASAETPDSIPSQNQTMDEPVKVAVQLEEVCLRTTSSFGLYETVTTHAVVIRVNVRC